MGYEYKKSKKAVCGDERPKLPADLCCDGCDEKCKLSLSLQIKDKGYNRRKGSQLFDVEPIVRAGDRELYNPGLYARVNHYLKEITVDFNCDNAKRIYQNALHWCRMNCKHSKMR